MMNLGLLVPRRERRLVKAVRHSSAIETLLVRWYNFRSKYLILSRTQMASVEGRDSVSKEALI